VTADISKDATARRRWIGLVEGMVSPVIDATEELCRIGHGARGDL
jgi:hypothetical protein